MNSSNILSNIRYQVISGIIAGIFFILIKHFGNEDALNIQLKLPINYGVLFLQVVVASTFMGIILGIIDSTIIEKVRKKKSFGFVVLVKILSYFCTFILILLLMYVLTFFVEGDKPQKIVNNIPNVLGKRYFWSVFIYLAVTSFLISTIREVNYKFGPGVFRQMLLGKYHQPKEEERIFMFLDLKSSTTYAEKLGHIHYSKLIQECFYDINSLLFPFKAEVYQYVGDEIVLTWTKQNGIENNNTLNFFFSIQRLIKSKNDYYYEKFGLIPVFKAGVNFGSVTVAEVGEIKRDIAFHGDVLNTASRIQGHCNNLNSELLISENLKIILNDDNSFLINYKGNIQLKGKLSEVNLYSVEEKR